MAPPAGKELSAVAFCFRVVRTPSLPRRAVSPSLTGAGPKSRRVASAEALGSHAAERAKRNR